MKKLPSLWDLFITFAKIGGVTFGGGIAMLPILERDLVEQRNWITNEELTDCYAIGQCTPGIIAVNVATFVGYRQRKTIGSIIATLGMVTPSLIIITLIAAFLSNFAEITWAKNAFWGIRVAVGAIVINAVVKLFSKNVKGRIGLFIFLFASLVLLFTTTSPIVVIIISALIGLLVHAKEWKK